MPEAFIKLDERAIKEAEQTLRNVPKATPKAIARALNRTIQNVRTVASKEVRATYTIKAGDFRSNVAIKKASTNNLEAQFTSASLKRTLTLSHFKFSPKSDTTGNKRRPVKATIKKGSPFKVDKGFVWNGNVFHRTSRERLPVAVMTGPTVPRMLNTDEIIGKLRESSQETFTKRLSHEIDAMLKGHTK